MPTALRPPPSASVPLQFYAPIAKKNTIPFQPPPEPLSEILSAKITRQRTKTTAVIEANAALAISMIVHVAAKPHETNKAVDNFAIELPPGTAFVGHVNTDMDSIASSIGAACLFNGTAYSASKLNTETEFALKYWELETPELISTVDEGVDLSKVCLMDHNQQSQIAPGVNVANIVGVIDHHALQSGTFITDKPIYIDIRPWGSACTIVAHTFLRIRKVIPQKIAGMLLSGILSDTLNLRSPTTTSHDELLVAVLAKISECKDIDSLADKQFAAKSSALLHISPYEVACGDQKIFNIQTPDCTTVVIGFGVVETTDPIGMRDRIDEVMIEVAALKSEQKSDFSFLAIVDIVKLTSTLLLIGRAEMEFAQLAFPGAKFFSPEDNGVGTMELPDMVSRKKDFLPPLSKVMSDGFKPSKPALDVSVVQKNVVVADVYGVVAKEFSLEACCNILVRRMKRGAKRINNFASMATPGGGWAKIDRYKGKNENDLAKSESKSALKGKEAVKDAALSKKSALKKDDSKVAKKKVEIAETDGTIPSTANTNVARTISEMVKANVAAVAKPPSEAIINMDFEKMYIDILTCLDREGEKGK